MEDERSGDICNACVLIVKRWNKRSPSDKKNWAHVVDARIGPGMKNVQRPKDQNQTKFPKIKNKQISRKKVATENKEEAKAVTETPEIPGFLDSSYWTRLDMEIFPVKINVVSRRNICCGIVYTGLLNEVMLDQRYYQKCSNHQSPQTVINKSEELSASSKLTETKTIDDAAFSESSVLWSDSESESSSHQDTDTDEGFSQVT